MIKHLTSWSLCYKSDRQSGFLVYNAQINSSDATGLTAGGNKRKAHGAAEPARSRENQAPSSTHNDCKDCLAFLCAMFQDSTMTSRRHFGFLPNYHGYLLRANDVCQECLPHALISLTSHVYSLHGDTGILIDHHLATKREQWGAQEHHVR